MIVAPEDNRDCKRGLLPRVILVALLTTVTVSRLLKESQVFNGFSAVVSGDDGRLRHDEVPKLDNKLLRGLLHPGFDNERSCLSRYEYVLYLKELKRHPSSSLISKLRSYEALHRRCGPYTESYNKSVELIAERPFARTDCKYVIWIPFNGLGNRILSLASVFLYAIVTNRVLLVAPMNHTQDLFCEPFPGTSWFLPEDFPVTGYFNGFDNNNSGYCYGNMVKNNLIEKSNNALEIPPFIYLNLKDDMDHYDELFFRDEDQMFLQKITWLSIKSDEYFIPSLFLMPLFQKDLEKMFPEKDALFHLLGRYLIHPANPVWELITRYHQAHLAGADEKIGIQVRVFDDEPGPFKHVLDQIIGCTMEENILPLINPDDPRRPIPNTDRKKKKKAVLVTSLSAWYSEQIKNMYSEHPTLTGEEVGVYQPSHEEYQQTENPMHNRKALAEMYLLSMSDVLVTSGWSTFGYVAQSLGGLRPWILYKPENRTAPHPPCRRALSMEPCYHDPPSYDGGAGALDPHVKHCEDRSWGLKLIAA